MLRVRHTHVSASYRDTEEYIRETGGRTLCKTGAQYLPTRHCHPLGNFSLDFSNACGNVYKDYEELPRNTEGSQTNTAFLPQPLQCAAYRQISSSLWPRS